MALCVQNKKDITVFTVVSIERLSRLADLAENWDGPMSVAVAISDISTELPVFVNAWLSNPKLRRNADIHFLFNDNVSLNTLHNHV